MGQPSPMYGSVIALSRRDVGIDAEPAGWEEVARVTSELPLEATCAMLSAVAQIAAPPHFVEGQNDLLSMVEPAAVRPEMARQLSSQSRVLVHPSQVMAAWRELAFRGNAQIRESCPDAVSRSVLWQWLMMITEALARDEIDRHHPSEHAELTEDSILSLACTASHLVARDWPHLLLARHFHLLDATLARGDVSASSNYIDIPAEVKCYTGLDWRLLLAVGAICANPGLNSREPNWLRRPWTFDPTRASPPFGDPAKVQAAIDYLSCDLDWLRRRHEELCIERAWPVDPLPFQEKPVLRLPSGRYCPLAPQFVAERVTTGVYHVLFNVWKERCSRPDNRFTTFWGELMHSYVDSLFEAVFRPSGLTKRVWFDQEVEYQNKHSGNRLPPDVMVDCGDTLVFFEFTTSRFTRDSLVRGDSAKVGDDVAKALRDKAGQLCSRIEEFRSGQFRIGTLKASAFKRFLAVVVVWTDVPISAPILGKGQSDAIRPGVISSNQPIRRLCALRLGELEGLLAAVHNGEALVAALGDGRWDSMGECFQVFRQRIGQPIEPGQHPVLNGAHERFIHTLESLLFGCDSRQGTRPC